MSIELRIPTPGETWVHPKSGVICTVKYVANSGPTNPDGPPNVIYSLNGVGLVSIPLDDWHREFAPCLPIEGKTIAKVMKMENPDYDDEGWLKLEFTDGTFCVIQAGYGGNTGCSMGEYPTDIRITTDDETLVPIEGASVYGKRKILPAQLTQVGS